MITKVTNWGNYPVVNTQFTEPAFLSGVVDKIKKSTAIIARGNGRCYGDSALAPNIISMLQLNRFLNFDKVTGIIECESGVMLSDILNFIVPNGYFLPVTPGTKYITLGGAIAADIHGKNHHKEGCFGQYVMSIKLLNEFGDYVECSRHTNYELFKQTVGGMGLTGVIISASFSLKKIETAFIKQRSRKARNLSEAMQIFSETENYTYSVAWVDCLSGGNSLGRSLVMSGEHANLNDIQKYKISNPLKLHSEPKLNVPIFMPAWLLNKYSVRAFNFLYYNKQFKKSIDTVIHYDPYFYPLDAINNWNRIYGRPGFTQYQFVLPPESSFNGLKEIFKRIAQSGEGSFLAVLKTMGAQNTDSVMSFPFPGYTLALDFKISDKVFKLLNELDTIVAEHKGRLYLAKDVRMSATFFEETYGYNNIVRTGNKFKSKQAERLAI
jgi:FAD/FMN-containing dehydrogenase